VPIQTRYLAAQVSADLARKMVFVAGPRQVGKTTLALGLRGGRAGYLNWDVPEHRERILRGRLPAAGLWVFDEIHKYKRWRNYLKGVYDGRRAGQRILVTGSGRLDLYRFGGDSLQGRLPRALPRRLRAGGPTVIARLTTSPRPPRRSSRRSSRRASLRPRPWPPRSR